MPRTSSTAPKKAAKKAARPAAPVAKSKPTTEVVSSPYDSVRASLESMKDMIEVTLASLAELEANDGNKDDAPAKPTKTAVKKATRPAAASEPDEDDADADEGDEREEYREELKGKSLADLKKLALEADFEAAGVKSASKEELIDALVDDKFPDDESGDSDDDSDDDSDSDADEGDADDADDEDQEDEEAGVTREELEAMSDEELAAIALEMGFGKRDIKGKDDAALIDMILGADEDEEEGDADEDGDDGDDDGEYWTMESLMELDRATLRQMLKDDFDEPVRTGRDWTVKDMAEAYLEAAGA